MSEAVARRQLAGEAGSTRSRVLASGEGWRIVDVLCTCEPDDGPGDDGHSHVSAAFVLAGSFQYRGERGSADLTAGSILFGVPGAKFTCHHGYGAGDRCLAVQFEPDAFEALRAELPPFDSSLPPAEFPADASTVGLFAAAEAIAAGGILDPAFAEEAAHVFAERAFGLGCRASRRSGRPGRGDARRIAEIVRWIEANPAARHRLSELAAQCGMSRFHFLRRFREATGMTPHAFVRRARIRDAARLLLCSDVSVIEVALEAGFADLSTFHSAFRQAMHTTPRDYRLHGLRGALRA